MGQLGLDKDQAAGSITAAADSVKDVLGGSDGFGLDDALNLFSSAKNTSAADNILGNIGNVLQSKLTSRVGLDASKASGVVAMLLPTVTDLVAK